MSSTKEELVRLIEAQPETSSAAEIVRELVFHVMIQRGLDDADAGRSVDSGVVASRIRAWAE